MFQSDEIFQPDPTLGDAGEIGPSLRLSLLRHLGELIRDLTCDTEVQLRGPSPVGPDAPEASLGEAEPAGAALEVIALSDYGDEAALHAVRMEALQVFETRPLHQEAVVVLWVDAAHLWGRPLVLCTAATMEGYHRILGFAEASLQDLAAMQQLFQDLMDRGLCVKRGLLCVTPGTAALSPILTECLGPQVRLQYCQMHKRERVISYLSEADRLRIRGAITRAFALPEAAQAHTALMQIHAELKHSNRSAAQWLLQDLEQTLTVHRSGLAQKLSSSLRSTRCIVRVAQHLNQRLRGVRHWLPPAAPRLHYCFWRRNCICDAWRMHRIFLPCKRPFLPKDSPPIPCFTNLQFHDDSSCRIFLRAAIDPRHADVHPELGCGPGPSAGSGSGAVSPGHGDHQCRG